MIWKDRCKIKINPPWRVEIDRKKAGELGISAAQVGQSTTNSILAAKAVFTEDGDEFLILCAF